MHPTPTDWIIIAIVPLVAWLLVRRKPPADNWKTYYFFNGNLTKLDFSSLYFGANITFTTIFLILSTEAYQRGVVVFCIPLFWILGSILFAWSYPKLAIYFNRDVTLHRAIGEAFQSRSLMRAAGLWTIVAFVGTVALEFYGAIKLMEWLSVPLLHSITIALIVGAICGSFTVYGGLRGAAVANRFLDFATILAVFVIIFFAASADWGAASLAGLATSKGEMVDASDTPMFVIAMLILFLPFQFCTLDTWQRCSASKSLPNQKRRFIATGTVVATVFCLPIMLGILAQARTKSGASSYALKEALFTLGLGPMWLGIVVAGFIAAIISTADSLLNCSSYSLLLDVIGLDPKQADASKKNNDRLVSSGKCYTFVFCLIAAVLAACFAALEESLSQIAIAVLSAQVVFIIPLLILVWLPKWAARLAHPVLLATNAGFVVSVCLVIVGITRGDSMLSDAAPLGGLVVSLVITVLIGSVKLIQTRRK